LSSRSQQKGCQPESAGACPSVRAPSGRNEHGLSWHAWLRQGNPLVVGAENARAQRSTKGSGPQEQARAKGPCSQRQARAPVSQHHQQWVRFLCREFCRAAAWQRHGRPYFGPVGRRHGRGDVGRRRGRRDFRQRPGRRAFGRRPGRCHRRHGCSGGSVCLFVVSSLVCICQGLLCAYTFVSAHTYSSAETSGSSNKIKAFKGKRKAPTDTLSPRRSVRLRTKREDVAAAAEREVLDSVVQQVAGACEDDDEPQPESWTCEVCGLINPFEAPYCGNAKTDPERHAGPMVWTGPLPSAPSTQRCPKCTLALEGGACPLCK